MLVAAFLPLISMFSINFGLKSMALKRLRKPVLIAGVLIGGASVFAGAAQADIRSWRCDFPGFPPGTSDTFCNDINNWTYNPAPGSDPYPTPPRLVLGDKELSNISYLFENKNGGITTNPSGHFDFTWNDPDGDLTGYADDQWSVITTFDTSVTGTPGSDATGTLNYTLSILGGQVFRDVELDSDHTGSGGVVTKSIPGLRDLVSTNGGSDGPIPLGGTTVNVTDTYTVSDAGSLDSFNNTFTQTPAPLPILGVGAAFGSIRKLRKFSSRLKTVSMG